MTQWLVDVPDILCLIFELLDKCDLTRLLRVSRCFFACAAPLVWAQISDPEKLLRVLPIDVDNWDGVADEAWVHVSGLDFGLSGVAICTFRCEQNLKPLNDEHLERFRVYTPYITKLAQHIQRGGLQPAWDALRKLVPARPLLPNLRELIFSNQKGRTQKGHSDPRATVSIIEPFLCPTLVEIHSMGQFRCGEWFHPLQISQLSDMVARKCPNIQILEIYSDYGTEKNWVTHMSLSSTNLLSSLLKLPNLRVLGISPEVLFPDALVLLGSLLKLESLSIYSPDDRLAVIDFSGTLISSDSFPALRHLAVYRSSQSVSLISHGKYLHLFSVWFQFASNSIQTRAMEARTQYATSSSLSARVVHMSPSYTSIWSLVTCRPTACIPH